MSPETKISDLLDAFAHGIETPEAVIERCLERLVAEGSGLSAVAEVRTGAAMAEARVATARWRDGTARPLEGVPVGIKDVIDVAGCVTAAGSPALRQNRVGVSAASVARLQAAGAIVVAKLATTPFAFADPSGPGVAPTRCPADPSRFAGATSSGSAAALAAGIVPLALGTDSAGSARIPAAHCGVVGFKPSFGAIALQGVLPGSGSLDHVGVMARSVEDVRIATSLLAVADRSDVIGAPRVGILRGPFTESCTNGALARYDEALHVIASLGWDGVEIALPMVERTTAIAWPIAGAEIAASVGGIVGADTPFGSRLADFLAYGRAVPEREYARCVEAQAEYRRAIEHAMRGIDILVCPTVQTVAPRLADLRSPTVQGYVDWLPVAATNTLPFNLSGLPAISLPIDTADDGLPFGLQLVGKARADGALLAAAALFEARWNEERRRNAR